MPNEREFCMPDSEFNSVLVALATYNEIDNLPTLVPAIHDELPEADLLVVDDNSPDGTGGWCDEFARQAAWFSCQHREGKLGLGSALRAAMQVAIDRNYQLLITLDADWSHPPHALPPMVAASKNADVVIGSRYCPGGKIAGWPWQRKLASRSINLATRLLLGIPVRDCSGNYRLYRTELLKQVRWEALQDDGYAYIEEILCHLHLLGAKFAEVPILFTDRRAGTSKINSSEVFGAARTLCRLASTTARRRDSQA